jgi:EamA domain-containing membrane protein RarD
MLILEIVIEIFMTLYASEIFTTNIFFHYIVIVKHHKKIKNDFGYNIFPLFHNYCYGFSFNKNYEMEAWSIV